MLWYLCINRSCLPVICSFLLIISGLSSGSGFGDAGTRGCSMDPNPSIFLPRLRSVFQLFSLGFQATNAMEPIQGTRRPPTPHNQMDAEERGEEIPQIPHIPQIPIPKTQVFAAWHPSPSSPLGAQFLPIPFLRPRGASPSFRERLDLLIIFNHYYSSLPSSPPTLGPGSVNHTNSCLQPIINSCITST